MGRQRGIYGKADSGGSRPQGERHDLQTAWGSSRYDEVYVCAEEERDKVRPMCSARGKGKLSFHSWYRQELAKSLLFTREFVIVRQFEL